VAQLSRFEINGLRRQAKYGDDSAAFTLGMAYEVGRYVRQNCTQAARWVTMAAEAGNPAAEYNLGLRYRDGDGVSADLHESEKWLRKAAAHRNRNAKLALQLLASR
jgi:TPR repeat protein